ncbi:MAG: hypothetical protein ABIN25_00215, partial [Ginsengibacter sp.]
MDFKPFNLFGVIFLMLCVMSCTSSQKIAYFIDVQDSALIASSTGLEPVIQKKDLLSISVSSLSTEATLIFNAPNLSTSSASSGIAQTSGYLVSDAG